MLSSGRGPKPLLGATNVWFGCGATRTLRLLRSRPGFAEGVPRAAFQAKLLPRERFRNAMPKDPADRAIRAHDDEAFVVALNMLSDEHEARAVSSSLWGCQRVGIHPRWVDFVEGQVSLPCGGRTKPHTESNNKFLRCYATHSAQVGRICRMRPGVAENIPCSREKIRSGCFEAHAAESH